MTDLTYRHNVMEINSLEAFVGIKGGVSNGVRDVYFVRKSCELKIFNINLQ